MHGDQHGTAIISAAALINALELERKKINEVRLWQTTGTTMVAYRRKGETVISPGPDYVFEEGDTIVVIGSNNVYEKVYEFLYS